MVWCGMELGSESREWTKITGSPSSVFEPCGFLHTGFTVCVTISAKYKSLFDNATNQLELPQIRNNSQ